VEAVLNENRFTMGFESRRRRSGASMTRAKQDGQTNSSCVKSRVPFYFQEAFRRIAITALNARARVFRKVPVLDPNDPKFLANPYPFYRILRERDPIHFHPLGVWLVARHADAMTVWSDPRFAHPDYKSQLPMDGQPDPLESMRSKIFVSMNPPDHTRLRKAFTDIFNRRYFDSLRPLVEKSVATLLDMHGAGSEMDVVRDLAEPLPLGMISEIMGVPPEDRAMLRGWSNRAVRAMGIMPSEMERAAGSEAALKFDEYFRLKLQERKLKPGTDVISCLARAQTRGCEISDDEIVANTTLLFSAGHETTVSLISNGARLLLTHRMQFENLRRNPALMTSAVEEILRYEPPAQFFGRVAIEDVELGGKVIRRGQTLYILVGAINRDPELFKEPEIFEITRVQNPHLTFGHGLHSCIGQYLARMEGTIALGALLQRFPNMRLASSETHWSSLPGSRVQLSMKVRLR
jgi:pimeloyl-[acyl-carrier protein] synthase